MPSLMSVESGKDIHSLIGSLRERQAAWAALLPQERCRILKPLIRLIQAEQQVLAQCIQQEMGKRQEEALLGDIFPALSLLHYLEKHAAEALSTRLLPFGKQVLMGRLLFQRRVPLGVVGVISPWNYPFAIPLTGVIEALLAGNAVMLKPSELTPKTGEAVIHLIGKAIESVFPQFSQTKNPLLFCLQGDGATGEALALSPIDGLAFTGSVSVGRHLAQQLAGSGKVLNLELGGSDPLIVLPSADLDAASSAVLWGRFTNSGQACAAVKRVMVHASLYEAFLGELRSKLRLLQASDSTIDRVASADQAQRLEVILQAVREEGAEVERFEASETAESRRPEAMYPALVTGLSPESETLKTEWFGPMLPVFAYESLEDAIQWANQSAFGLGSSVFGAPAEAEKVATKLQAGVVTVNDLPTAYYAMANVPWQGWKQSGPGVSHGTLGLLKYTRLQTLVQNACASLPGLVRPYFSKPPWFFVKAGSYQPAFLQAMLKSFTPESWLSKLSPALWWALLKNHGKTRL